MTAPANIVDAIRTVTNRAGDHDNMIVHRNILADVARLCTRTVIAGLVFTVFGLPVSAFAIAHGLGFLLLPYQLYLVLQRLPLLFPLHMVASGLALMLIPVAILTRRTARLHRLAGRLAAGCVVLGGLSALPVAIASVASVPARIGFFVQGVVWLGLLAGAIAAIRRGRPVWHARLMFAMASVASGAIWLRFVLVLVGLTRLPFELAYAVAAWACWLGPLSMCIASWPRMLPRVAERRAAMNPRIS